MIDAKQISAAVSGPRNIAEFWTKTANLRGNSGEVGQPSCLAVGRAKRTDNRLVLKRHENFFEARLGCWRWDNSGELFTSAICVDGHRLSWERHEEFKLRIKKT